LLRIQNREGIFVSKDLPEWANPAISSIVKRFSRSSPKREDDNESRRGTKR